MIISYAMLIGNLLKKPVKELSGGQKQRVALALSLIHILKPGSNEIMIIMLYITNDSR